MKRLLPIVVAVGVGATVSWLFAVPWMVERAAPPRRDCPSHPALEAHIADLRERIADGTEAGPAPPAADAVPTPDSP